SPVSSTPCRHSCKYKNLRRRMGRIRGSAELLANRAPWRAGAIGPLTATFRLCQHSRVINLGGNGGTTTMRRPLISVAGLVGSAGLVIAAGAPAASAASAASAPVKFNADLATLWTKVFETPSAQNPFGSGGAAASACWNLDGSTVAPFGPSTV